MELSLNGPDQYDTDASIQRECLVILPGISVWCTLDLYLPQVNYNFI